MGLYALEDIFEQVAGAGLAGDELEDELLRLVKLYNYVPDHLTAIYRSAIASEYRTYVERIEVEGND